VGYEVLSLADREVYARKSIRKLSYFEDVRRNIERFRCELQVLRRIKHRHCVQIVSVIETGQSVNCLAGSAETEVEPADS
jgi:serine/threonine protein kinase